MEYQVLTDCEGIELESGKPFRFACCDCGLVHDVVIVSADDSPVGFAVKRNDQATTDRRQSVQADTPDLITKLTEAANYIDALGGNSKAYRAAIAHHQLRKD
jgi:hypothetical protein